MKYSPRVLVSTLLVNFFTCLLAKARRWLAWHRPRQELLDSALTSDATQGVPHHASFLVPFAESGRLAATGSARGFQVTILGACYYDRRDAWQCQCQCLWTRTCACTWPCGPGLRALLVGPSHRDCDSGMGPMRLRARLNPKKTGGPPQAASDLTRT